MLSISSVLAPRGVPTLCECRISAHDDRGPLFEHANFRDGFRGGRSGCRARASLRCGSVLLTTRANALGRVRLLAVRGKLHHHTSHA
jgi:hypothetical protein